MKGAVTPLLIMHGSNEIFKMHNTYFRARSQILAYGVTGRGLGGRRRGQDFVGKILELYIPCVGTHLWITMAAKSDLSYCQIYWCE